MRVGVYDQWWPTAGGGEKFAGGIAEVLSADHEVSLIAHEPIDLDALGERLQLDLSKVEVDVIPLGTEAVEEASAELDLFVNASYMSGARCRAAHGLYVVHFPTPPSPEPEGFNAPALKARAKKVLRPLVVERGQTIRLTHGFHPEEMMGKHRAQWTTGDATVEVRLPEGERSEVRILLGRFVSPEVGPVPVDVSVDGVPTASTMVRPWSSRFERPVQSLVVPVVGRSGGAPIRIRLSSPAVVPAEKGIGADTRHLGVPVLGAQLGTDPRAVMKRRYPSLAQQPVGFEWLESYDRVVSNSRYTRRWVRRWWDIDTAILNPPVTLQARAPKENIILNVGRFFAPEHGHSKKQLDMVRAMRALEWRGRMPGWTLHLVGGCSEADRPYLDKVHREAEGLPVEIHVDAPGSLVRELYGKASIYWHATGLGEDPDTQPDRFEHFGITTVEAMSAGAVPVVILAAGQEEVVEHGVSGLNWEPLVQLVCFTEDLVLDPERLESMSLAAEVRATDYGMPAFTRRLHDLVADITAGDTTSATTAASGPTTTSGKASS